MMNYVSFFKRIEGKKLQVSYTCNGAVFSLETGEIRISDGELMYGNNSLYFGDWHNAKINESEINVFEIELDTKFIRICII